MDNKSCVFCLVIRSTFLLIVLLLASCDDGSTLAEHDLDDLVDVSHESKLNSTPREKNVYTFGFDLRSSPQEDARQYLPFLHYLESKTGYKFKLSFTPKNSSIIESLGTNQVQFAAVGADTFLRANQKYGVVPLVRGLNHKNNAEYQSVFVVLPKSKIKDLNNIRGKHIAFGSRTSTQGHLIPRIVLNKNGIKLENFASLTYTGSHINCANAVISAKADVCAMQDTMALNMEKQGLLRIIHTSKYFPSSGVVASTDLPSEVIQKVKQVLIDFRPYGDDKPGLYHWDNTEMPRGFIAASVSDYKELLDWSIKLGFIKPAKTNK